MRIITWNVFNRNKKIKKGIRYILSLSPDVICLQEVPLNILEWLKTVPTYTVSFCHDWINRRSETKNCYICTLTKQKTLRVQSRTFGPGPIRSILNTFIYMRMLHNVEQHRMLAITIKTPVGKLQIVNTRLSCASDIISRLEMFHDMIQAVRRKAIPTIYCGDFNIFDSKVVKLLTGWLRGFHVFDYRINERIVFEILFAKERLVNIFRGKSTIFVNRPLLQLDHILIPNHMRVKEKHIEKRRHGSDHRMLYADITNETAQ